MPRAEIVNAARLHVYPGLISTNTTLGLVETGSVGVTRDHSEFGDVTPEARRLADVTRRALDEGIANARVGRRVSDISHAVQQTIEREGFGIVREFVGHGIGRALHEDPPIPNFGSPNVGPRLKEGMTLAIEPMVTLGGDEVKILHDGWTAVTQDRSLAAHFEHTVAVTAHGPEVLTAANAISDTHSQSGSN